MNGRTNDRPNKRMSKKYIQMCVKQKVQHTKFIIKYIDGRRHRRRRKFIPMRRRKYGQIRKRKNKYTQVRMHYASFYNNNIIGGTRME